MQRRSLRALVVAAALSLALGLVEIAFRLHFSRLPSLAALDGARLEPWSRTQREAKEPVGCRDGADFPHPPPAARQTLGEGGKPLVLVAAGDSVTAGFGVTPADAWPAHLAEALAQREGRAVELTNVGIPGANFCKAVRTAHGQLDRGRVDLVVLQLFADDLARRAAYVVGGKPVAFPELAPRPLDALVSRSYAANYVWFQALVKAGDAPERFVTDEGRDRFRAALRGLRERVDEQGGTLVVALLAPQGLALCEQAPEDPDAECNWMKADLDLMARMLGELDQPFVDLRVPPEGGLLPAEEEAWKSSGKLPVHPDARGQKALAEAILSGVPAAR